MDNKEYIDLHDTISFEGFDFLKWYEHEKAILQPRLEEQGYEVVEWMMGEHDSFGPLTRICAASKDGKLHWFIYG